MGNSPETTKKGDSKSPVQSNAAPPPADLSKQDDTIKVESTKAEPLAPPPRPTDAPVASTPDYFSNPTATNLTHEPNPFEFSFAGGQNGTNGSGEQTPGGTKLLPSVAAITSPAGILGPASSFSNIWGSSLRSGPLSPAMLSGPQKDDYFSDGHHLRGGFPTPNESSMRSGLTPGGGGSMFPDVQTPNTAALYGQLQSGGATPTTLDFHRTAMAAAAHTRRDMQANQQTITSQPQDMMNGMEGKPIMPGQFNENDAANGLFLLANTHARNTPQAPSHYAMAQNMPVHSHPQPVMNMGGISQEASPTMANRTNGSISTTSGRGMSEMSDEEQPNRPNTRGKGKRNSTQISNTNGRQKETPSKPSKKAKTNAYAMEPEPVQSEEEHDMSKDEYNANGKKMTDEEKRKNFLERNRVAALKCRQRKKQWLANLQQKVELFSTENDVLSQQIGSLRDEVVNLKTMLVAHKDCPVSLSQGHQQAMAQIQMETYGQQMNHNPYGMAAMNGPHMNGQSQSMQYRRGS